MGTLNNQKQMQNKRFANIDLEEWEKSKQNPSILRAKNNLLGNCQKRIYWISRKVQWGDLYFLLGGIPGTWMSLPGAVGADLCVACYISDTHASG